MRLGVPAFYATMLNDIDTHSAKSTATAAGLTLDLASHLGCQGVHRQLHGTGQGTIEGPLNWLPVHRFPELVKFPIPAARHGNKKTRHAPPSPSAARSDERPAWCPGVPFGFLVQVYGRWWQALAREARREWVCCEIHGEIKHHQF